MSGRSFLAKNNCTTSITLNYVISHQSGVHRSCLSLKFGKKFFPNFVTALRTGCCRRRAFIDILSPPRTSYFKYSDICPTKMSPKLTNLDCDCWVLCIVIIRVFYTHNIQTVNRVNKQREVRLVIDFGCMF